MAQRFQGITSPLEYEEHGSKFDWLLGCQIQQLGYPETQLTEAQITRSLEAYILWLLGKVMFTENHVTTITAHYIPIALEIANATSADMIIQRSWGSAVLAATYQGMCNGCQRRAPKSGLLGCPLLLQLWSWERFPISRPDVLVETPYPTTTLGDPLTRLFDPDLIDLPTFGSVWTHRQRRFSHS
uniref:Uncharacterized protein n=1 Tax=Avena sativa TaxID=4498 RepID=A0ACD5ZKL9_AVESA